MRESKGAMRKRLRAAAEGGLDVRGKAPAPAETAAMNGGGHEAATELAHMVARGADAVRVNRDTATDMTSAQAEGARTEGAQAEGARVTIPEEAGVDLARRVEALPEFAAARTVALYAALPDEAPTAAMLARWAGVKRLALPVIVSREGVMVFREYTFTDGLSTGAFGIDAPVGGAVVPPEEIDLMLVPGVAFDAAGGRLGRGGGFYDRYLSAPAAARIYKVGLCPPHTLVLEVPTEAHDVAMNTVLFTEV